MWFPAALISSTLITIIGIVAVYKIFLEQPQMTDMVPKPQSSVVSSTPATSPESLESLISDFPSPSPTPRMSTRPSVRPSSTPAIIVLENNTQASTSYSSFTTSSTPTGTANISGILNLSGSIPTGTSVVIVARPTGTNNQFQVVVSGIKAENGTAWSWGNAKHGTSYDMVAILKGSSGGVDTDYADSQTYVVNAPAYGQIFDINAGYSMDPPTGAITTTCTNKTSNNTWSVSINFPSVNGAQSYWLQIGKSSGESDLAQVKQNASSANYQIINTTFTDSVLYYARYAVASVTNANDAQYSAFSNEQTIKCP